MDKKAYKKWFIKFISLSLCLLLVMGATVFAYDPYCYYRIPKDRVIVNNYRFVNPGIVRNAEYDTVVMGSSMIQNFNMQSFRDKLGLEPIKLSVGGMSIEGMDLTYSQVCEVGKAKNLFVAIDLPSLNKEEDSLATYSTYLYNDTVTDDYKYLLGYETWTRLLPLNIGFNLLSKFRKVPASYVTEDIDHIGEWYQTAKFSKEKLKKAYLENTDQISKQDTENIDERMKRRADMLLDILLQDKDTEVTVFFSPYSALFWYQAQTDGYYESYMRTKEYVISKLLDKKNVKIYDFQQMPEMTDLDNYKDTTHYSEKINEKMVDCFVSEKYAIRSQADAQKADENINALMQQFIAANSDWLKK